MKRFYCAGVVGLALLFTGAARASDFGCNDGNTFTSFDYKDKHGCDYKFKFDPCDDKDSCHDYGCDKNKYDDKCGDPDPCGKHSYDPCHKHDHGGCDPAAVPLPPASALGGLGMVMAGAVKWLRSRRPSMA
jgi:hypothetical protein